METCLVYITAPNAEEAVAIGRDLVEREFAACANVHSPIVSIYRWEGAIQEDSEVVLIAKTRRDLVDELSARVADIHSYDCPCVVALPIEGGHAPFLEWIGAETRTDLAWTALFACARLVLVISGPPASSKDL